MKLFSSKSLHFIFYSACSLLLFSCSQTHSENEADIGTGRPKDIIEGVIAESDEIVYDLIYMDTLPCKDCGGIKTTLKLSTKSNKFNLKEEFLKTEIAPNVQIGNFNTERGFEKDQDATVYILNDELPESEHQYYLRETGQEKVLVKLDGERKKTLHTNFVLTEIVE